MDTIPGLSPNLQKTYTTLLTLGVSSVNTIASALHQPRSSVLLHIHTLEKMGLAQQSLVGKRYFWKAANPTALLDIAQQQLREMRAVIPALQLLKKSRDRHDDLLPDMTFYKSQQGIKHIYEDIVRLRKGEKVYSFEGTQSVAAKSKKLTREYIVRWQRAFKQRGIIFESCIGQGAMDILLREHKDVVAAHVGRPVVMRVLPDEVMNTDIDLIVYGKITAFVDIQRDIAIVVHDVRIARTMRAIFSALALVGQQINVDRMIGGAN